MCKANSSSVKLVISVCVYRDSRIASVAYNRPAAMITISKEDYLKAIFEAESESEVVISATVASWLKVSQPADTMALRRLKRDRLVKVDKDGRVRLTSEGRRIAERLAVRHLLVERMLTEIFGMAWYRTHNEAERLEHAVSAEFESPLAENALADPAVGAPADHPDGDSSMGNRLMKMEIR